MKEENVKKRGWVKNAAIVFLAVMLALTFFSQTIMNRSLPEVAAQYTSSGAITARIRGSGTVSANDNYEVILNQTRTVRTVNVRLGNEVSVGDVLFTLADTGSDELEDARQKLYTLLLDLEIKLIRASLDGDYASENRDIRLKREDIEDAQQRLGDLSYSEAALTNAQNAVDAAEGEVTIAQMRVNSAEARVTSADNAVENAQAVVDTRTAARDAAQDHLDALDWPGSAEITRIRNEITRVSNLITTNRNNKAVADIVHGANYVTFVELAEERFASPTGLLPPATPFHLLPLDWEARKFIYLEAFAQEMSASLSSLGLIASPTHLYAFLLDAYETITPLERSHGLLVTELNGLNSQLSTVTGNDLEYTRRQRRLTDAQALLNNATLTLTSATSERTSAVTARTNAIDARAAAESEVADAKSRLAVQEGYRTEWRAANDNIRSLQRQLEGLLFSLSERQKTDGVEGALTAIEMRELRNDIEKTREDIERLEEDDAGATILSPVSGIVSAINISPGNTTTVNQPLAVIEVTDRGYTASLTVTEEQARRVSIGDRAEVNRGWWGAGEIYAVLRTIRNDPQNPAQNRILDFDVSGDVESGTQLNITLGQRSQNYEIIVPNSSLRSDTNGDFVLVVVARSSPLGNRYIATRVNVTILAADDLNSAVSGGLSSWGDFVITTSTRPIEPGMQVRLVDNPW